MKKLNYFKAMSLWRLAEKATTESIISSINEDDKYPQEKWDQARREFYDRLIKVITDHTKIN